CKEGRRWTRWMSFFKWLGGAFDEEEAPRPQDRPPDFDFQQYGARPCSRNANHAPMSGRAIIEHDPGPSNMRVNTIIIETTNSNNFDQIMSKQELELYTAYIRTMCKPKDKKIHPANVP